MRAGAGINVMVTNQARLSAIHHGGYSLSAKLIVETCHLLPMS